MKKQSIITPAELESLANIPTEVSNELKGNTMKLDTLNEEFTTNDNQINTLKVTNSNLIKSMISILIKDSKEYYNNMTVLTETKDKKAKKIPSIIFDKIVDGLNPKLRPYLRATYYYVNSKSKIDFNDELMTNTKFRDGFLKHSNEGKSKLTNKTLLEVLKKSNEDKAIKSAKKLLNVD